jgi:hypothetical protein
MKTAIIVILCIIGYMAIGFCLLVLRAKKYSIRESDSLTFLIAWPIVVLVNTFEYGFEHFFGWVTKTARSLGDKLSK